TQANFVRAFDIPKSSSPGKYILYSRITYAGGLEASAEHSFDVVIERQKEIVNYMLIVVFLLIAAIYLFYRSVPLLRRAAVSFKVSGILKRKGIS
ncbi:hypothetical protein KY358_00525, partial [Candidatus Woesearchaeota archaeon]|nr:hypothetical protein [Candidatus Woesearchaeota archaeon]